VSPYEQTLARIAAENADRTSADQRYKVQGLGFWVLGSGFRVLGSGFWVLGSELWVLDFEFRVQGLGCRV